MRAQSHKFPQRIIRPAAREGETGSARGVKLLPSCRPRENPLRASAHPWPTPLETAGRGRHYRSLPRAAPTSASGTQCLPPAILGSCRVRGTPRPRWGGAGAGLRALGLPECSRCSRERCLGGSRSDGAGRARAGARGRAPGRGPNSSWAPRSSSSRVCASERSSAGATRVRAAVRRGPDPRVPGPAPGTGLTTSPPALQALLVRQARTGARGPRAQVGVEGTGRGGVCQRLLRRVPSQKLPAAGLAAEGGGCEGRQGLAYSTPASPLQAL